MEPPGLVQSITCKNLSMALGRKLDRGAVQIKDLSLEVISLQMVLKAIDWDEMTWEMHVS